MAIRSTVRILSRMTSFSCLNEYFFPEISNFGRLTGQTEMTGIAEVVSKQLGRKPVKAYFGIRPKLHNCWGHFEKSLVPVRRCYEAVGGTC